MICVHDFPCGEVSVKVGIMELELYWASFDVVGLLVQVLTENRQKYSHLLRFSENMYRYQHGLQCIVQMQ